MKPMKELIERLMPYNSIYIVGCGGCVTVCQTGGEKAARELSLLLSLRWPEKRLGSNVILRQCEPELVDGLREEIAGWDVVLSLACGVGVQLMAERMSTKEVLPGLNTRFMGAAAGVGVFEERCLGCGDCLLEYTGGICPISRCAKGLLNGYCGGSQNGYCEVGGDRVCAWHQIYERLKERGQLDRLRQIRLPRDWRTSYHGGPRRMVREDLIAYER